MDYKFNKKAVGKRLSIVRKKLDLLIEVAASYIKKESRSITAYETGQNAASLEYLHKLCTLHNVNINYVLTGEGEMFLPDGSEEQRLWAEHKKDFVEQGYWDENGFWKKKGF